MMTPATAEKARAALALVLTADEMAEFEALLIVKPAHHTVHRWAAIGLRERERILAARDEQLARERAARPSTVLTGAA